MPGSEAKGHDGTSSATDQRLGRDAFGAHFAEAFRVLWLIAVSIVGDRTLAEDVVQEAAIIGLDKLNDFAVGTSFVAWMGQMVRYVALNHARKEQRRRAISADEHLLTDATDHRRTGTSGAGGSGGNVGGGTGIANGGRSSPVANLRLTSHGDLPADQGALDDVVVAALEEISTVAKTCLLLRTVEGLEYRRIAQVLDIPEGTAMSHVHRARKQLRLCLGQHPDHGGSRGTADTGGAQP